MGEKRMEDGGVQKSLPCAVVRDLMPLEIDGVASPESGEAVRAHLEGCEGCRAAYARMREDMGAKEPVPALRDVMRALGRRLSVRAALAAVAAALVTCAIVQALLTVPVNIPTEDVIPESVQMTIADGRATLRYMTKRNRQSSNGYTYLFEINPEREDEVTLYVANRTTPLHRMIDSACYALTGKGTALHEIELGDLVSTMLRFGAEECPPDATVTAVVYREDVGDEAVDSVTLWQAKEDEYAQMTVEALGAECRVQEAMDDVRPMTTDGELPFDVK